MEPDIVLRPLSLTTLIDSSSYTHNPKSLLFNHSHSCNISHSLYDTGGSITDDGEFDGIIRTQESSSVVGNLSPVFSALHISRVEAL